MSEQAADTDQTVYQVTYFNGASEEVTGLNEVRRRIIDPTSRIPEAQEVAEGATYRVVSS